MGLAVTNGGRDAVSVAVGTRLVRVWTIENDRDIDQAQIDVLDDDEKQRWSRLTRQSDRTAFLQTRLALRSILSHACRVPQRDIRFERNSWGKPFVGGPGAGAVEFSVSHAEGLSVIAVSDAVPVGIDVERLRSVPDKIQIAQNVFGIDVAQQLPKLPKPLQDVVFLQLWTAAEAFLKAQGVGFAGWGGKVPLGLSEGRVPSAQFREELLAEAAAGCGLAALSLPFGYVGSIATGRLPQRHVGQREEKAPVSSGCG